MIKTKEQLLDAIKLKMGEEMKDEDISLLEDLADTFDSFENKDETDWKSKYEENDKEWRKRYTERFFEGNTKGETEFIKIEKEPEVDPATEITIDDLFK